MKTHFSIFKLAPHYVPKGFSYSCMCHTQSHFPQILTISLGQFRLDLVANFCDVGFPQNGPTFSPIGDVM